MGAAVGLIDLAVGAVLGAGVFGLVHNKTVPEPTIQGLF